MNEWTTQRHWQHCVKTQREHQKKKQKTKIKQNKTKNAHKNTKHTHIHKHNTENQKAENVEQHESTKKVSTRFILRFRI